MIRSMTAFSAAERQTQWGTLSAELRSVNHRYLELSLRLPDDLRGFEPQLREQIGARISRGKLELGLRLRSAQATQNALRINSQRLQQLAQAFAQVSAALPDVECNFTEVLRYPGVVEELPMDSEGLGRELSLVIDQLLDGFVGAREREGQKLAEVMIDRLNAIDQQIVQIRQWLPEIRQQLEKRLRTRLADLDLPADSGRLEQELVISIQKMDVEEELDRLATHITEARRVLAKDDSVGRRLDFLLQEFNREANTLGSKSIDTRTSQASVELKVLIEQIREQVQNVE